MLQAALNRVICLVRPRPLTLYTVALRSCSRVKLHRIAKGKNVACRREKSMAGDQWDPVSVGCHSFLRLGWQTRYLGPLWSPAVGTISFTT